MVGASKMGRMVVGAEDKELSRPEHHAEGVGTHRAEGMETFEDPLHILNSCGGAFLCSLCKNVKVRPSDPHPKFPIILTEGIESATLGQTASHFAQTSYNTYNLLGGCLWVPTHRKQSPLRSSITF